MISPRATHLFLTPLHTWLLPIFLSFFHFTWAPLISLFIGVAFAVASASLGHHESDKLGLEAQRKQSKPHISTFIFLTLPL